MRLLAMLAASCFLTLGALEVDASVVSFQGTILGGTGSLFGTIPPDPTRPFTLEVDYTPSATLAASITGGTFVVAPGTTFGVTGGTITVVNQPSPSQDMAAFTVNVASGANSGVLSFIMDRDAISASVASQSNIEAIVLGNSADNFIANFGAGGTYVGSIANVPEPSSCLAMLGLVGGGAWGWRRRKQRATA